MRYLQDGLLLGGVLVLTHLPLSFSSFRSGILFLGLVADPEETHAVWYGMLNMLGIFDLSALTDSEQLNSPRNGIISGSARS